MDDEIDKIRESELKELLNGVKDEADALLTDPDFFNIAIRELDKEIVGEYPSRKVLLLCMNGKNVINSVNTSYNLLVNDETGSGKDHITKSVGKLFNPESIFIHRTRISPKVLNYWHTTKRDIEEGWSWDGKILYLEDISYEILNNETMRTFLSSGSHTTILKDQFAKDLIVNGKPIVIVTTALVDPQNEMLRRMNILNLDTSVNQTKEIAKRKLRLAKDGYVDELNPAVILAINKLNRIKVKIPFADKLADWIDKMPDENVKVILRTQIQTFLDYIRSATAFYQQQRRMDKEGYYLSEKQDYEIAKECFQKMQTNPFLIPLTKNQQKIIETIKILIKDLNSIWIGFPELSKEVKFLSDTGLRKNLLKLAEFDILDRDYEKRKEIDRPVMIVSLKELNPTIFPEFDELKELE